MTLRNAVESAVAEAVMSGGFDIAEAVVAAIATSKEVARELWDVASKAAEDLAEEWDEFGIADPQDVVDAVLIAVLAALNGGERVAMWPTPSRPCPNEPHTEGLVYASVKDVMYCQFCGHQQYEEMGG